MSLPTSSPRLPSPPPPTEIQIGSKSPAHGLSGEQENAIEQSILDANAARRIHPGTKSGDMAAGPPLVPLMELDSAFQLQEHLKALHHHHTKPTDASHSVPISRSTASLIASPPHGVDRDLWLYELCRFLINKCNDLIVGFLFDSPPCSSSTCPEMRASEWQFLCAVHESPKSCCAIDYCCHTLDWATNIVTSQKIFPSRLSLSDGDATEGGGPGFKHLINIFRRLHRIFAHAWFQHRGVFWQIEGQTGLYVLFKRVCDSYDLLPAENYKLPPEAEGLEEPSEEKAVHTILKPELPLKNGSNDLEVRDSPDFRSVGRTNTRRHIRSSPSTGSAVTTVLEADFEEDVGEDIESTAVAGVREESDVMPMMKEMTISESDTSLKEEAPSAHTFQDLTVEAEELAKRTSEAEAEAGVPAVVVALKNDDLVVEVEPESAGANTSADPLPLTQPEPAEKKAEDDIPEKEKNAPRTSYNLGTSLVAPEPIVHELNINQNEGTVNTAGPVQEGESEL